MKITYLYDWLGKQTNPTLFLVAARLNTRIGLYYLDVDNFSHQLEKISLIDLNNLSNTYFASAQNRAEPSTLEDLFIYSHKSMSFDFKTVRRDSSEFKRVMKVLRTRGTLRPSRLTPFSDSTIDEVLGILGPQYIDYRPPNLPIVLRIPLNSLEKLAEEVTLYR